MSAVPKKKLCWNCEGNVAREVDNCTYCGVYLQAPELDEDNQWNPSYQSPNKTEDDDIPSPIYRVHQEGDESLDSNEEDDNEKEEEEE